MRNATQATGATTALATSSPLFAIIAIRTSQFDVELGFRDVE
jgi:amino acid permease